MSFITEMIVIQKVAENNIPPSKNSLSLINKDFFFYQFIFAPSPLNIFFYDN